VEGAGEEPVTTTTAVMTSSDSVVWAAMAGAIAALAPNRFWYSVPAVSDSMPTAVQASPLQPVPLVPCRSPLSTTNTPSAPVSVSAVCVLAIRADGAFRVERVTPERPAGLLRQVADGAAALRAHPAAVRLVGADIVCSLVYGMQTVLFILVARSSGLGLQGYGYLFAALGAGGLAGTALASRAARMPCRAVLVATLAAVGLPVLLLAVVHWGPAVIVLAGATGTGAILVQIMTETGLQRTLPHDVFGRAYGLAIPVSIGGIGGRIADRICAGQHGRLHRRAAGVRLYSRRLRRCAAARNGPPHPRADSGRHRPGRRARPRGVGHASALLRAGKGRGTAGRRGHGSRDP
jgi:hypothetical protein